MNAMEKFFADMKRQRDIYLEILAKAEEQKEAVEAGNESRALGLAEEKAALLGRLREADSGLAEVRSGLSDLEAAQAERETGNLRNEIQSALEKIVAIEESCETILKAKKSSLQQKMAGLREGKAMIKNYGRDDGPGSKLSKKV